MMTYSRLIVVAISCLLLFGIVSAVPTIGAASSVTSNNATFAIAGSSGSTVVMYGQHSGHEVWRGDNATAPTTSTIWGAPLMGGTTYYATACDDTGCGNEVSFTMATITPVPTHNYDASYNGIIASHWSLTTLGLYILAAYTTNFPTALVFGFIIGCIIVGIWRKTKSTRLVLILLMCLSPLIMSPTAGLMLGIPLPMQALGAALFAVALAGVVTSLIKK